MQRTGKG